MFLRNIFPRFLTASSPFEGAAFVSTSIDADPGPSGLFATTINLYFAPGSKPIRTSSDYRYCDIDQLKRVAHR